MIFTNNTLTITNPKTAETRPPIFLSWNKATSGSSDVTWGHRQHPVLGSPIFAALALADPLGLKGKWFPAPRCKAVRWACNIVLKGGLRGALISEFKQDRPPNPQVQGPWDRNTFLVRACSPPWQRPYVQDINMFFCCVKRVRLVRDGTRSNLPICQDLAHRLEF